MFTHTHTLQPLKICLVYQIHSPTLRHCYRLWPRIYHGTTHSQSFLGYLRRSDPSNLRWQSSVSSSGIFRNTQEIRSTVLVQYLWQLASFIHLTTISIVSSLLTMTVSTLNHVVQSQRVIQLPSNSVSFSAVFNVYLPLSSPFKLCHFPLFLSLSLDRVIRLRRCQIYHYNSDLSLFSFYNTFFILYCY